MTIEVLGAIWLDAIGAYAQVIVYEAELHLNPSPVDQMEALALLSLWTFDASRQTHSRDLASYHFN